MEWSYIGKVAFGCSLNLSPNVLEHFNVLFISLHPVTFISAYYSTFFKDVFFILRSHRKASNGLASSKVHLYPIFVAYCLQTLTQPFGIRSNHIRSLAICSVASRVVDTSFVVILDWSFDLELYSSKNHYT